MPSGVISPPNPAILAFRTRSTQPCPYVQRAASLAPQSPALDNRVVGDDHASTVFRPGDVTYLHIPCRDPTRAADFYEAVFAWKLRRGSDEPAFADATGNVIGHFIVGAPPKRADASRTFTSTTPITRLRSSQTAAGASRESLVPRAHCRSRVSVILRAISSASGPRQPPNLPGRAGLTPVARLEPRLGIRGLPES